MKFNKLVATFAIISFAAQAGAQDGTLRRVAQNDQTTVVTTEVVNTTTTAPAMESQQPATVVEAAPVVESKAESLRKARQGAEISTEQKIVEKLEESRLKEEQERADRLFGNKLDAAAAAQLQQAASAPAQKVEVQPATVVTPVAPVAPVAPQPTQVTIEKVEIIQPAPVKESAPVVAAAATSEADVSDLAEQEEQTSQWYVDASLGAVSYDASNVKGNFGGGFSIGMLMNERTAIEAGFLYSNHFIDTFWQAPIYREMDQYEISLSGKYNILTGRLRPWAGAGAAYVTRSYQQRVYVPGVGSQALAGPSDEQTDSINLKLMAGVDFQVSNTISIGAGVDYSTNVMNRNEFNFKNYYQNYAVPEGTKAIEEIDFVTTKVTAKMSF